MKGRAGEIVVAGHICLDMIPAISVNSGGLAEWLIPGKLVEVGPALVSTGGAVANTGLALYRLGFAARLMGKVGNDLFGKVIMEALAGYDDDLTAGMIVAPGEVSSYSIVLSPPGVDRIFLHATGANDTFCSNDVRPETLEGAKLFHFGYPPLMRRMYERDGEELVRLLSAVKTTGVTVCLDLAKPDPGSPAGRADWRTILSRTLPYVDVFLPSFEEVLYMLRPESYVNLVHEHGQQLLAHANGPLLASLSDELLGMGAAVIGLKLGEYGMYVRSSSDRGRIVAMGGCAPSTDERTDNWTARELLVPSFQVKTIGTTGAGDCTIAGFLGGLSLGLSIEQTMLAAVGTGASSVEHIDAVSGVKPWQDIQSRIEEGWPQNALRLSLPDWNSLEIMGCQLYEQGQEK